jgi:DNA-binding MarR family transcriptional regulator
MNNAVSQSPGPSVSAGRSGKASASYLDLDAQLCFALYSSSLAMTRAYKPLLSGLGLTYPQYLVLLALWQHGPMGVGELGALLFLDSGTLTPLCKRMQALGLVQRQRSAEDERHVEISLTAAGIALRTRAEAIPPCVMQLSGCDLPQIESLTRELQDLRDRLVDQSVSAAASVALANHPSISSNR